MILALLFTLLARKRAKKQGVRTMSEVKTKTRQVDVVETYSPNSTPRYVNRNLLPEFDGAEAFTPELYDYVPQQGLGNPNLK